MFISDFAIRRPIITIVTMIARLDTNALPWVLPAGADACADD